MEKQNTIIMKKTILLFLISIACTALYGQDIIVKRDGGQLKCNVIKYDDITISYKLNSSTETKSIPTSGVLMIIFSDGNRKVFSGDNSIDNPDVIDLSEDKVEQILNEKSNFFLLSFGYGDSYGSSWGARAGYVFGDPFRVGINLGLGMYDGHPQFAIGTRLYFYREWGVNLAYQTQGYIYNTSSGAFLRTQQGFSLMLSYDQFIVKNFGITGSFGGFIDTNYKNELSLAGDVGIILRF
jgi:hypothetical protein